MTKPVILAVDDDATVLGAIERDLRQQLVQRHEGTIDMASEPGRTSFRVSVPAAAEDPR